MVYPSITFHGLDTMLVTTALIFSTRVSGAGMISGSTYGARRAAVSSSATAMACASDALESASENQGGASACRGDAISGSGRSTHKRNDNNKNTQRHAPSSWAVSAPSSSTSGAASYVATAAAMAGNVLWHSITTRPAARNLRSGAGADPVGISAARACHKARRSLRREPRD